jgi:iron complex transport system permease protein
MPPTTQTQDIAEPTAPEFSTNVEGRAILGKRPGAIREGRSEASRWIVVTAVLMCMSFVVVLGCARFGAEPISIADIVRILFNALRGGLADSEGADTASVILLHIRLPRVLLSFLVGGSLAVVGVVLQALLRNPLADPYVLGISSGAAFGAGLAILLGIGTTLWALSALPLFAFAGGLLALLVVYQITRIDGQLPVSVLLLAGVILNAIFSACIMFVTSIMEPTRSFGMMTWLMGALTAPTYASLCVLAVYLITGSLLLARLARPLNLLALGEQAARSLGVEVEQIKHRVFLISALMTGAVVSVSGMIGFVGMLIPHTVRMVLGADHRLLLPAAFFIGAMFLMIADTIARTVLAPAEIPVGIVTALAGGPFFIYLLVCRKGGIAR